MNYRLIANSDGVQRTADRAFIPRDPGNADWNIYLTWCAAGNAPAPVPVPPADWVYECERRMDALFAPGGISLRGSMNTWAASVALTVPENRTENDRLCARMVPLINAWEGLMFAERDRLIKTAALPPDIARWPEPPQGAAAFIDACNQG